MDENEMIAEEAKALLELLPDYFQRKHTIART